MAWIVKVVKTGAEGDGPCVDVMEIDRPDDLRDIAALGLTLAEAKRLLASVQQEIVTAQTRDHAARRPACPRCGDVCRVKDYRDRGVATLFGLVTVRLPRFRCAACGGIEAGIGWPLHCRSTPELDQLQAHLSALMTYRTAADFHPGSTGAQAGAVCIARDVIPHVRPPVCCVQYAIRNRDIASNTNAFHDCTQQTARSCPIRNRNRSFSSKS